MDNITNNTTDNGLGENKVDPKLTAKIDLTISLDNHNMNVEHYMLFGRALAHSMKYARAEGLSDFGMKKKLLETLFPTSKSSAKRSLLNGKVTPTQIKEIRQLAGYEVDGEYLNQTAYKG